MNLSDSLLVLFAIVGVLLLASIFWLWRRKAEHAAGEAVAVAGSAEDAPAFWQRLVAKLTAQPVLWLFLVTFAVVAIAKPVKIGLLIYGICKLACFAFAGDWSDAKIFADAQPEKLEGIERGTAWKRKGLIVAASIIAGALLA
jgi:hypothetical protein